MCRAGTARRGAVEAARDGTGPTRGASHELWGLLVKAVESLDLPAWVALYVRRWLAVDAVAAALCGNLV